jgi:hypothetical protein
MDRLIIFKTAKLAKEKGFHSEHEFFFCPEYGEGLLDYDYGIFSNIRSNKYIIYPAYSQTTLSNWLLEEHGLFISVELAYNEWGRYSAGIFKKSKDGVTATLAQDGLTIFDNPTDAWEEALFEALSLI